MKWIKCIRKPVMHEFREVEGHQEAIFDHTRGKAVANSNREYILRDEDGNLHVIDKATFHVKYDIVDDGK
jgi:hypothetical protein